MSQQVTVTKGNTVRVVPAELAKKYEARGFTVEKVGDKPASKAKADAGQ